MCTWCFRSYNKNGSVLLVNKGSKETCITIVLLIASEYLTFFNILALLLFRQGIVPSISIILDFNEIHTG